AGEWCDRNGFKIDALSYYEKTGNYEKIVSLIYDLPYQIPYDIAKFTGEILERAPAGEFIEVNALAAAHIRVLMGQGRWQEAIDLAGYYEKKFIRMPGDSVFKKVSLGCIYYCWGMARIALCVTEDRYDFNIQFKKFIDYISGLDIHSDFPHKIPHRIPPPWIVFTGSSRKGAPEECISALANTVTLMTQHFDGRMAGEDDLAWGELKFYQGDIHDAELSVIRALERAREFKQHEIIHRALFYFMRIAIVRGNYEQAAQALKDMETNLNDDTYTYRFINYDISLCWYYCALFMPEKTPDWLKENFSPYAHAIFIENYANQAKARYCYQSRNYAPLLSYIQEMRQRESFLFGRAEMFAIEACIYYKTGDRKKAYGVLEEAWKTASPNNIVIPFIELGKDMRTLTASLLKENTGGIPAEWLENINKKSSSYAKQLAHVIAEYNQVNGAEDSVDITPRELEVLEDLSHGLTRAEIAASHGLSINTVKMVISNLYTKMGAKNLPDVIHIATERKII
ncbi:MAG: LuxR C-terminal-related transcriptional regulator, partial [Treponema sp.]|nr:LuxR C-terminal-related transcriptional regulator [Treponema sp.]